MLSHHGTEEILYIEIYQAILIKSSRRSYRHLVIYHPPIATAYHPTQKANKPKDNDRLCSTSGSAGTIFLLDLQNECNRRHYRPLEQIPPHGWRRNFPRKQKIPLKQERKISNNNISNAATQTGLHPSTKRPPVQYTGSIHVRYNQPVQKMTIASLNKQSSAQ